MKTGDDIQVVKIDPEGRYLLVMNFPDGFHPMEISEIFKGVSDDLRKWWESGERFGVVAVYGGVEISLERIDDANRT